MRNPQRRFRRSLLKIQSPKSANGFGRARPHKSGIAALSFPNTGGTSVSASTLAPVRRKSARRNQRPPAPLEISPLRESPVGELEGIVRRERHKRNSLVNRPEDLSPTRLGIPFSGRVQTSAVGRFVRCRGRV